MKSKASLLFFFSLGCVRPIDVAADDAAEGDEELTTEGSSSEADDGPPPTTPDEDDTFIPSYDVPPDEDACDVLGSDECGPGRKCSIVYDLDFRPGCVDLADETVPVGSACQLGEGGYEAGAGDNCGPNAVCWDVMPDGFGTCLEFCGGSDAAWETADEDCGAGYVCNFWKDLGLSGLCTPICKPLEDDCPATCGCFFTNVNFFCVPLTENIPTGEPCSFINDCARDHICVGEDVMPDCNGSSCCAAFCELGSSCEQAGTECVPFFEAGTAPAGLEDVGVCILPD